MVRPSLVSTPTNPQLPNSPTPQLPNSSSPQLPKSPSPQVPKSPRSQFPNSPIPQLLIGLIALLQLRCRVVDERRLAVQRGGNSRGLRFGLRIAFLLDPFAHAGHR